MILWTCQADLFWELLQKKHRLRPTWRHVHRLGAGWLRAYRWMSEQMVARGCCRRVSPPIWAWHSCGAPDQSPDKWDLDAVVTNDGHRGYVIEFDPPEHLVLLSHYGRWNDVIDECITARRVASKTESYARRWKRALNVDLGSTGCWEGNHNHVQACVPMIRLEWVRSATAYLAPDLNARMKAIERSCASSFGRRPDRQ
jgi:hypothetical protein